MEVENKTKVSDADRASAELLKNKGNDFFKKGDYEEAINYYTKAIGLNPNDASYYCNRAACYMKLKKYFLALLVYINWKTFSTVSIDALKILTLLLNLMRNTQKLIVEKPKHILELAIYMYT